MKITAAIFFYLLAACITTDSYSTKFALLYDDKPEWFQSVSMFILWPLGGPVVVMKMTSEAE